MALSENTKDILSFGAHGRVQNKLAEHEEAHADLIAVVQLQTEFVEKVNSALADLLTVRRNAIESLRQIRSLAKHLSVRDRVLTELKISDSIEVALQHVEATLTGAEIAENALQGVTAGASAALGVWALSATGSGLAAGATAGLLTGLGIAPAAMAGFTGGSLAAGGAVAGAAVIGSVAVIPAAVAMAIASHFRAGKKIKEIEAAISEIRIETEKMRVGQMFLENMNRRSLEISAATEKTANTFRLELAGAKKRLFPLGFFSRWLKAVRKIFGFNYFSRHDVETIAPLLQIGEMLAKLIDQKILDEDGKVY